MVNHKTSNQNVINLSFYKIGILFNSFVNNLVHNKTNVQSVLKFIPYLEKILLMLRIASFTSFFGNLRMRQVKQKVKRK